jgi:CRP/FNR family transcriptional regulator, nitrogen oxide reductase regulator
MAEGPDIVDAHHCSREVRLEMLGRAPLFRELEPELLADVNERCRAVAAVAGDIVHRAGEPADRFHVVATGLVKLVRYGADGRAVLHDVVAPGESFGSLRALGDPVHDHEAVVVRPGCLLSVSTEDFRAMLREVPGVAEAALAITVERLHEARGAVDALATLPVGGRLAASLVRLAGKIGERTADGVRLTLGLSQGDLAAMAATSPESVSRTFARWRQRGILSTGAGGIVIRDLAALERLGAGEASEASEA